MGVSHSGSGHHHHDHDEAHGHVHHHDLKQPHDAHHHDHAHGHSHGHGHHHHPAPNADGSVSRAFALGAGINIAFVLVETGAGLIAHSMALLADAAHNLSDVLGLVLAWGALALARRAPTARRTYGLRKATVLASLTNAVILLVVVGGMLVEAGQKLLHPSPIGSSLVIAVALIGAAINGGSALLFTGKGELNSRGAFLHLAGDAGVSVGVALAALAIRYTGWLWLDPLMGLAIALVILFGSWSLLRDSLDLAMDAAPRGVDPEAVKAWLSAREGVCEVHDMHIWAMSTTETALTAHVVRQGDDHDAFLAQASEGLEHDFHIGHVTLQVEGLGAAPCRLAPAGVV